MIDLDSDKNVICFYHQDGDYGCFSNWFPAEFFYCDQEFSSVEQFMMYHKVMMFLQYDLGKQIMASKDPAEIKKLGRTKFSEFDADVWDKTCYAIVKRGVRAKFAQNDHLLEVLLFCWNKTMSTGRRRLHFVECLYLFTVLREIWTPCFSRQAAILLSLRLSSASKISWIRRMMAVREKIPFPLPLNISRRGKTPPLNSIYFPATAWLHVETWIPSASAKAERGIERSTSGPEIKYSRSTLLLGKGSN